jgi:hypothetical protein
MSILVDYEDNNLSESYTCVNINNYIIYVSKLNKIFSELSIKEEFLNKWNNIKCLHYNIDLPIILFNIDEIDQIKEYKMIENISTNNLLSFVKLFNASPFNNILAKNKIANKLVINTPIDYEDDSIYYFHYFNEIIINDYKSSQTINNIIQTLDIDTDLLLSTVIVRFIHNKKNIIIKFVNYNKIIKNKTNEIIQLNIINNTQNNKILELTNINNTYKDEISIQQQNINNLTDQLDELTTNTNTRTQKLLEINNIISQLCL